MAVKVVSAALGEIGVLVRGNGLQKAELKSTGVPAIHYGEIHTHYGVWAESAISFVDRHLADRLRRAEPGNLVIATTSEDDAAVGKAVAWLGTEAAAISGDAVILRHDLNPKFVSYFFQSAHFQRQKLRYLTGTKMRRISSDALAKIRIPVPSKRIQSRIVSVLDEFASQESKLGTALDSELRSRRRHHDHCLIDLFSRVRKVSKVSTVGEIGRVVTGRTPSSMDNSAWGDALDFITPGDIVDGYKFVSAPVRRLSEKGGESLARIVLPSRSVLVTCIGTVGKVALNENLGVTNQQVNSIVPVAGVSSDYLFHLLSSMRDELRAQGDRSGGTLPIINKSQFSRIELPIPAPKVQAEVSRILDELYGQTSDLSRLLPAEQAARRKQYEYYRDKLLTFED